MPKPSKGTGGARWKLAVERPERLTKYPLPLGHFRVPCSTGGAEKVLSKRHARKCARFERPCGRVALLYTSR